LITFIGRIPVTVNRWGLVGEPRGFTLWPMTMAIGKPVPCQLEAGESETWAVAGSEVQKFVTASAFAFEVPTSDIRLRGKVELGDGRTHLTPTDLGFARP
jgi:hypothetical protein